MHRLRWVQTAQTTHTHGDFFLQSAGTYNAFEFTDVTSGIKMTSPAVYCKLEWHFVMITADKTGKITMYVDGANAFHDVPSSRSFTTPAVSSITIPTANYAGDVVGAVTGEEGFFRLGAYDFLSQPFAGFFDDVRVYGRVLDTEAVSRQVFAKLVPANEVGLVGYYTFDIGQQPGLTYSKYAAERIGTTSPPSGDTTGDGNADSPVFNIVSEWGNQDMNGFGLQVTDLSGKGNHLTVCSKTAASCPTGTTYIQYIPSPVSPSCPVSASPDVIHAAGGETVTIRGNGFSPSPWLTCAFSLPAAAGGGVTHARAAYVSPFEVTCVAPAMPAASVASVEVANDGVRFSDQSVPVYYLEKALAVNETSTVTVKNTTGVCAKIGGAAGYTLGAWVYVSGSSAGISTPGGGVLTLRGTTELESIQVSYWNNQLELSTGGQQTGSTYRLLAAVFAPLPSYTLAEGAGWHHVALSVTGPGGADGGRKATLYVDGDPTSLTYTLAYGPDTIANCELAVGGRHNRYSAHLVGLVDDVQVWGKALDDCGVRHAMWGDYDVETRCPHAGGAATADHTAEMVARLKFDGNAADSSKTGAYPATPSSQASFAPTSVPYLPASFNRKKPYDCAAVARSHLGPGGISEPYSLPRKCAKYLTSYLADAVVPVGGLKDADVVGFGFAQSKWLKCKVGNKTTPATFASIERIQCEVPEGAVTDTVAVAAVNALDDASGLNATSGKTPCYASGSLPPTKWIDAGVVTLLESVLAFDGKTQYVTSSGAGNKAGSASASTYRGFTFGAWFMPTPTGDTCERMPVVCFAPQCSVTGGAANIAAQVCLEYTDGRVYVTSDVAGGAFNLTADAASIAAAPNQWHYAELRARSAVAPPEDGGLGSVAEYFATLTVDGVTLDRDVLIPARPSSDSVLFVGGLGCPSAETGSPATGGRAWSPRCAALNKTDASRYFEGFVDEVRLFQGPVEIDWSRPEPANSGALAYYRFNPDSGPSQTEYYFKSNSTTVASSSGFGSNAEYRITGVADAVPPAYDYKAVPWAAAMATGASPVDFPIDGGGTVTMTGQSFAASPSLKCVFVGLEAPSKASGGKVAAADPVSVPATFVSDSKATCQVPAIGFASAVTVHVANAFGYAGPGVTIRLREQALRLQGGVGSTTQTVQADADVNAAFTLTCPAGTRVKSLSFANFGTPVGRCVTATDACTQEVTTTCPTTQSVNPACSADVTAAILAKCEGLNACTFTVTPAALGVADPCAGTPAKWLMVTAACDDSWRTQDYVMAPAASAAAAAAGAYTLSMWVYPGTKDGLQAVAAFTGTAPGSRNRAIVQWKPDGGGSNAGMFYYYDDKINDVAMDSGTVGTPKKVTRGRWYHLAVAVHEGSGTLYLDGAVAATFSTTSRPDVAGSLLLGVDLDAAGVPGEYFEGWLDEVSVHTRALTAAEVAASVCYARPPPGGLVAHFRFNDPNGAFPPVAVKNHANATAPGELVASTSSVWNATTNTWAGQGLTNQSNATAHPTYEFSGAPWFPATVLTAVAADGSAAVPLGSGVLNLGGVNLASTLVVDVGGAASTVTVTSDVEASVAVGPVGSCSAGGGGASIQSLLDAKNPNGVGVCGAPPAGWGGSTGAVTREVVAADLVRGLVCHYAFAGGSLTDLSGNGNDAVVAAGNAAAATAGKDLRAGTAYALPSAAAKIAIAGCVGAKTVAAWIKVDDDDAPSVSSSSVSMQCPAAKPSDAGAVRGVWVFYAGVVNDTTTGSMIVYAGVSSDASLSPVASPSPKVKALLEAMARQREIGGAHAGGFTGAVDSVWVYNRELCAAELTLVLDSQEFALRTGPNGATVTAPVAPGVLGVLSKGLVTTYYLGAQKSQAMDPDFTVNLPTNPPGISGADGWTAVKTGYMRLPGAGTYTFHVTADDAVTLRVAGGIVAQSACVSNAAATCAAGTVSSGVYTASSAGDVAVELTFTDKTGAAAAAVEVESAGTRRAVTGDELRAGTGPVTLAAWVNPADVSAAAGEQTVLALPSAGGEPGLSLGVKVGGALVAAAQVSCGAGCLSSCEGNYREAVSEKGAVAAGRWQHVAASYDGARWTLYIDGGVVATRTFAFSSFPAATAAAVLVGAETAADVVQGAPHDVRRFDGLVFSATLHARALNATEVATLMRCKAASPGGTMDPDLVAYLALEEGMGTTTSVASATSERAPLASIAHNTPAGISPWRAIPRRCGGDGGKASAAHTRVAGAGLRASKAGVCTYAYVAAHNPCGGRVSLGGDDVAAELVGPLHLHTSAQRLSVANGGVVDHGDGTYTVRFTPLKSGFYQLVISVGGVQVSSDKLHVVPAEVDASKSYVVGDAAEPVKTDELSAPVPGTQNRLTLVAVDAFGNRLNASLPNSSPVEVNITGPATASSTVTSNGDGTYAITYALPSAGDYRMRLTIGGDSVCFHGGRECCDQKYSALEACSQLKTPSDPVGGSCRFCLRARDVPQSVVFNETGAAVPHHATAWRFNHPWTISAWVKKTGPSSSNDEYVAVKWLDGYTRSSPLVFLRLGRVGDGAGVNLGKYTIGAGAAVATGLRQVTSPQVTLNASTWHHVAATYDGDVVRVFLDGVALAASGATGAVQYAAANPEHPLYLGSGFVGAIGDVTVYKTARSPTTGSTGSLDRYCPIGSGGVPANEVLAVFPFDEPHGADGATNTASKDHAHVARLGFLCAQSTSVVQLQCGPGQVISGFDFANYGASSGTCTSFVAATGCQSDVTARMMELCGGAQGCIVNNYLAAFGAKTCDAIHGAVTLSVQARCTPAVGGAASHWLAEDGPSHVGGFSPERTLAGAVAAVDAAAATATAGAVLNFTVPALDACGTPTTLWDANRHVVRGSVSYPSVVDVSLNHTCPSLPRATPKGDVGLGVLRKPSTSDAAYCAERGGVDAGRLDVSVLAATSGSGTMSVELTRGTPGDADHETRSYSKTVTVAAAAAAAKGSRATGSALASCEAGVPAVLTVYSKDAFGNARVGVNDTALINVSAAGPRASSVSAVPVVDATRGAYTYTVIHPVAGNYTMTVAVGGETVTAKTVTCREAAPRKVITFGAEPPARFEHAAATVGSDAFIFGGVVEDKSYTDEMWKFSPGNPTGGKWTWRVSITVTGLPAGGAEAVFTVSVDTKALIESGKMREDCADVRFMLPEPSGAAVQHWIEPVGTRTGCGSENAQFWVKSNANVIHMYYGNVAATDTSTRALFAFFEDFETASASPAGWSLDAAAGAGCGQPAGAGELATFFSSDDVALAGARALKAAGATRAGGAIVRDVTPAMTSFFLQAYVYDSTCAGAAWISPAWGACVDAEAGSTKNLLPGTAIGAGVQSSADPARYATTYPWTAALGANRTAGWHTLAFRGNTTAVEVLVDGVVVKTTSGTTLSKIMIRADPVAGATAGADFYWDGIFAAAHDPNVRAAVTSPEEAVLMAAGMGWTKVVPAAAGPAPRQGHSLVVDAASGDLLVYGGERSGYAYGDVWRFAPGTSTWTFAPAVGAGSPPPGRHDHSAVSHGGALYVYGGRTTGGAALGDFWKFELASQEWTQLPSPPGGGARFGHTAAVAGDAMLVYGGYVDAGEGEFTTEMWSYDLGVGKKGWIELGPREANFETTATASVNDAIVFPSPLPPGRFSHLSLSVGAAGKPVYYVFGGLDDDHATPLEDAWAFDPLKKEWAVGAFPAAALKTVARYDAALATFDANNDRVLVFGGLREGAILGGDKGDTYAIYLGL